MINYAQNSVTQVVNVFNDDMAINAARLSFNDKSDNHTPEQNQRLINYLVKNKHINPFFHPMATFRFTINDNEIKSIIQNKCLLAGLNLHHLSGNDWAITSSAWGLMEFVRFFGAKTYLSDLRFFTAAYNNLVNKNDKHFYLVPCKTPEHHQPYSFEFFTEMATKAQLYTHSVGLAKSSISYRYKEPDSFHTPISWRGKADNVKQGSSDEVVEELYGETPEDFSFHDNINQCLAWYQLNEHICNEQRRLILPQATMSKYVITGTREAWERILKLRNAPDAQKEIRDLMPYIGDIINSK